MSYIHVKGKNHILNGNGSKDKSISDDFIKIYRWLCELKKTI